MSWRKPISRDDAAPAGSAGDGQISWNYDRAEIIADAFVHAAGVVLGLAGAVALIIVVARRDASSSRRPSFTSLVW